MVTNGQDGHKPIAPRHVSLLRKAVNILGCIISIPLYWLAAVHCRWPVTLDLIITIMLAEINRYRNEGRRIALREGAAPPPAYDDEKRDPENMFLDVEALPLTPNLDCMAAVVGWREDPDLFTRALESYKSATRCTFVLVGVDGDEDEDQDMVRVFNKVYPKRSQTLHVPQPLGEMAEEMRAKQISTRRHYNHPINDAEINHLVMQHCIQQARNLLSEANISLSGPDAVRQLCVRQRHLHKKGIMFTAYVFALVIADELNIDFLWSSDSDTIVYEDSVSRTVDAMAADHTIGGASSGLVVHNGESTAVTKLAQTVYWGELYLTRSTSAATTTSDCQSGPSTLFRLDALPAILVPWYGQTLFGKRMIINEDRHLTTNLLSRGWGVVFASDVLTATDTPTTLTRWLRQQVRWGRATHIESLLQPRVYLMSHPLLFHSMAKRESGPVIAAVAIVHYLFTARTIVTVSVYDVAVRCLISALYNVFRNPHRLSLRSLAWVIPGMVFYYVPLPAVHVWSMMTLTADGWGTSMRAVGERVKKDSVRQALWETGFFVVWMTVVAGVAVRWMGESELLGVGQGGVIAIMGVCMAVAAVVAWKMTVTKAV